MAKRHGFAVGLVQSDYPFSFVWGFCQPKLVVSSGLLAALTPSELMAVLEHEAAHLARHDNLVKLGLVIAAHASLAPFGRRVLRWRNEQVELLCDEIAAARGSEPLDIAEALVKLRRRAQMLGARPALAGAASPFVADDDQSVERRVSRLGLSDEPLPAGSLTAPRRGVLTTVVTIFVGSLVALGAWAPLAVHAATEALIQTLR
jgi:beta-lactamase regulating signal transducer with metallopeptidase domain